MAYKKNTEPLMPNEEAPPAPQAPPSLADWREMNDYLAYEERLEAKRLRDEKKSSEAAARQQGRDAMVRQRAEQIAKQGQCPHMKPMNAGSAIAGQRDHQNTYHWICQYCAKEWTGGELPQHLRIDQALVGGPNF